MSMKADILLLSLLFTDKCASKQSISVAIAALSQTSPPLGASLSKLSPQYAWSDVRNVFAVASQSKSIKAKLIFESYWLN